MSFTFISFWEAFYSIILLLFYGIDVLLLFAFGVHTCILLYLYRSARDTCLGKTKKSRLPPIDLKRIDPKKIPFITIQLPIYNEFYVVERLLKSMAEIQWPRSKLEIQVLDDSTDKTSLKLRRLVRQYRKEALPFVYLHRKQRTGYKAGALKAGLKKARGEFIAIFDADFCPPSDFLLKTLPYFKEEDLGMLQSRWGHLNAKHSLLTRAQAMGIDGHFVLEQSGRSARNFWINFNGTAGVWRRRCILEAGNWQTDTLTEDLDLSYRAELAGWNFRYLLDLVCPAEIPSTVAAFKGQQFRWCKGSIQTAMKLSKRIWHSEYSWKVRWEAIARLFRYSVHPLMLCNMVLCLPLLMLVQKYNLHIFQLSLSALLSLMAFLCLGSLVSAFFYIYAQAQIYSNWPQKALYFPALMLIGTGVSLNNTLAYWEALSKKRSFFWRTPKLGLTDKKRPSGKLGPLYGTSTLRPILFLEFALGLYCACLSYYAFLVGHFILSVLTVIYACGFLYLSLRAIWEAYQ